MSFERVEIGESTLFRGDCRVVLPTLPDGSADAIVTDPPAGIEFMGKDWDSPEKWKESHSAFGFRGSGIGGVVHRQDSRNPNCRRCHKHIRGSNGCRCPEGPDPDEDSDYQRRAKLRKRESFIAFLSAVMAECLRVARPGAVALVWAIPRTSHWTATACEDAGWIIEDRIAHIFGTGFPKHKSKLKPACEDWWLCRKPGPKWLGVEACRIPYLGNGDFESAKGGDSASSSGGEFLSSKGAMRQSEKITSLGRWPAHLVLDEEAAALLDEQSGELNSGVMRAGQRRSTGGGYMGDFPETATLQDTYGDSGGASRFFYVAKADKTDRGKGNKHPTVKSTALMRWLVRLACPEGGTVLDPFAGSGSTGKAAVAEGCRFVGIEREDEYFQTACRRLQAATREARDSLFPAAAPPAPSKPTLFDGE